MTETTPKKPRSFPILQQAGETVALVSTASEDAKAIAELVRRILNTLASEKVQDDDERTVRVYEIVMEAPADRRARVLAAVQTLLEGGTADIGD